MILMQEGAAFKVLDWPLYREKKNRRFYGWVGIEAIDKCGSKIAEGYI